MHSPRPHAAAILPLLAAALLLPALLLSASDAHAFFRSGVDLNIITSGSSTTEGTNKLGEMTADPTSVELDDNSSLGINVYGTLDLGPYVGAGLSLRYFSTVEFESEDKTTFEYGSQLDLNLLLEGHLPTPVVNVTVFAEGGLSLIPLSDDFKTNNNFDTYDTNEAATFGYNISGGVRVGYRFIPTLGGHLGLAYQYYNAELFNGSTEDPTFGTQSSTLSVSGGRLMILLGADFSAL